MARFYGMVRCVMKSILKLLLANIRHGRGAFKGIVFLMMLITFSFSGTVSNNDRLVEARTEKFEEAQVSDLTVQIFADLLSEEMLHETENNPHVGSVRKEECIFYTEQPVADGKNRDLKLTLNRIDADVRVFNEDGKSFAEDNTLRSGEIYLPYKTRLTEGFSVGSEIRLHTNDGQDECFTVKGYFEDVLFGAATSSAYNCILSGSDYDRIRDSRTDSFFSEHPYFLITENLYIDACDDTTPIALRSILSRDTDLISSSTSAFTKDFFVDMIEMFSRTGTRMVSVFVVLLLAVILITMHNSISASIELDCKELGILKSQGFTSRQISLVYILQYTLALLIGSVLGILVSVPACSYLISLWKNISGLMTGTGVSFLKCAVLAAAITLVCTGFICMSTAKIGSISPLQVIAGSSDVHFDTRLNTRIRKTPLSFFLSLRQLTSRRKNYIGTTLIVSLLVFFIISIMILAKGFDTESMFREISGDISIGKSGGFRLTDVDEIEAEIREIDSGAKIECESYHYMLLDGEQTAVHAYRCERDVFVPTEGRVPKYDNEIMITRSISEQCGKKIGEDITLRYLDNEKNFIITGYFDSFWDFGLVTQITPEAMTQMGNTNIELGFVRLSDPAKEQAVTDLLNSRYGDQLSAEHYQPSALMESLKNMVETVMQAMVFTIYVVLLSFAAVIVGMVCKLTFIRERKDTGIFKAIGFSSGSLCAQFSLRFAFIALIGSALGAALGMLFSKKLIVFFLRTAGMSDFTTDYSPVMFLLPAAAVCICFYLTALISARRIRQVEVRELITE